MKVKINTFYKAGPSEGWNSDKLGIKESDSKNLSSIASRDAINLGVTQEKTEEYAKQISDIIDASPDLMKDTIKSFGLMVDNVLQNPENVKKILELISAKGPLKGESPLQTLIRESNTKFHVLSIHADLINNPALKRRLIVLSDKFNKDNKAIIENTHKELNSLTKSLS